MWNLSSFAVHQSGCMHNSFFHKSTFIFYKYSLKSHKMSFQEIFDIIIITIVHLLTVNKERFGIIWTKKAN